MIIVQACTMLIVHACTMIIVPVSCPTGLMFREVKDGGPGAKPPKKASKGGLGTASHNMELLIA